MLQGGPMALDPAIERDVATVGRIAAVPRILQSVANLTGMRFAAVARVTDEAWTACVVHDNLQFGLGPGGQLPLETTLCNEIRQHHRPIVFGQASSDPVYAFHRIPALYGFESYISIPIHRTDGRFFGTLCALDPAPAKLEDPNIVATLELFAQLIGAQLEIEERLLSSDNALLAAEDVAKWREQFIAVLGHDLRGPLQVLSMGVDILCQAPLEDRWSNHLSRMRLSCERMNDLIHDILDFARGRLGGGIPLSLRTDHELQSQLTHVVSEVQAANPTREIRLTMDFAHPVQLDDRRVAQLAANLLANAVTHGGSDGLISIAARSDTVSFELSVHNNGQPISEPTRARLFEPFWRAHSAEPALGLGLGLYIASEIARAHGGTLDVSSSYEEGTRFVFRMTRQ